MDAFRTLVACPLPAKRSYRRARAWYDCGRAIGGSRYENGVLLPVDRLGLRPGESVNLIVVRRPVAGRWDLPKLAKAGSAEDLALAEQGLAEWASALETMERS
jgi:predicted DNA-binding antitoxin AbrB/MazE fold protein